MKYSSRCRCSICAKEGRFNIFYSINDGFLCRECVGKLKNVCFSRKPRAFTMTGWKYNQEDKSTILKNYTVKQARQRLEYLEENQKLKEKFKQTKSSKDGKLIIDEINRLFYIKNKEYEIFDLNAVNSFSVDRVYDKRQNMNIYELTELRLMIELKHAFTRYAFYSLGRMKWYEHGKIKKAKDSGKETLELLHELTKVHPGKVTKTYCIDRK